MSRLPDVGRPRRLLVVSGHYPPDFVSGGTLVPQALARAMRDRGWDVSVYAGALHSGRRDLDAWDAMDSYGLPVRWIGVAGFTSWNDRASFDNPAVTEDFRAHVEVLRPGVVHLHNLQAVGAGLVPAARAAGARVVVTAHDFWWWCARQFLCDRNLNPCALVSVLGDCACQVSAGWRQRRAGILLAALRSADVVLAPSKIAARVLIANGVSADQVRVDENGLEFTPPRTRPRPRPAADHHMRLLFVGGHNALKGLPVLLDALDQLAEVPGWTAGLYGVAEAAVAGRRARARLRPMPPYAPDRLDEVLADHDVLVLPSLARESYSRITREALLAGLPVVTSDALGPEEAVEDGVNGFVVPTADAGALAEVLQLLICDRALLDRLRSATPPRVRSGTEQADGLDALYSRLLATDPVPAGHHQATKPCTALAPSTRAPRQVLLVAGIHGAPLRYRVRHLEEALHLGGIDTEAVYYRDPRVADLMLRTDAVVLYRVPMTRQLQQALDELRTKRPDVPVLFDVDDLIVEENRVRDLGQLRALPEEERVLWFRGVRRYRRVLLACNAATASTPTIAATMVDAGVPAFVVANGVGGVTARRSTAALNRPRTPGPLRLGYFSGTATHDHDWALVEAAVGDVLRARPEVQLWLVGHVTPGPGLADVGDRVERVPFTSWTRLPQLLRDVDVMLAPLVPGEFADAKSAIKWLEAALVRTPTIASPTKAFAAAIDPGRTGFLAATGDEWREHVLALLDDKRLRDRIGRAAEREALLAYGPHPRRDAWLRAWAEAARRAQTGEATAHAVLPVERDDDQWPDEPSTPEQLEPYPFPAAAGGSGRVRASLQHAVELAIVYRSVLAEVWRNEGARGVAAKTGRRVRRFIARWNRPSG